MARDEVDAAELVHLFDLVTAAAEADAGRPIEEVGVWHVARAVVRVLGAEVRAALRSARAA